MQEPLFGCCNWSKPCGFTILWFPMCFTSVPLPAGESASSSKPRLPLPRASMRRIILATLLVATLPLVSCTNGKKKLTPQEVEDLDFHVRNAMEQYDQGQLDYNAYNAAYDQCNKALAIDPTDLQAKLVRAWTLLQTGKFEPWINEATRTELPGARMLFNDILADSPNEFRARQGLAAIDFKEFHQFQRKAEIMRRLGDQFSLVLGMVPDAASMEGTSRDRLERVGAFLKEWKVADEAYRKLNTQTFPILTDPEASDPLIGLKAWVDEAFMLDEVMARIRREAFRDTVPHINYFRDACAARASHWDLRGLDRLQRALRGFEDLERTGPGYYAIKYDLALAHMAVGDYFLRKALADADKEFRSLRPDLQLSPAEMSDVVASYFADESLHKNPRRELVKSSFAAAIAKMKEFVKLDEEAERTGEQRVDRSKLAFTAAAGDNAVTSDILSGYEAYSQELIEEMRARRKVIILNLLVVLTYPQYLNQDLNDAKIWASALITVDVRDRISYFIRGVIFEKNGELEAAVEEYQRFLDHSSAAQHYNRREYARDRIRIAKYEIARRRLGNQDR